MTYPQQKAKIKRRGFTLIEALVAISILLVGILGPFMLTNMNLQAGLFSRDQITAYYLAQEAIEMVREVRDENFIQEQRTGSNMWWLSGLSACITGNTLGGCRVDGRRGVSPPANRFQSCLHNNCEANSRLSVNTTLNSPAFGEYGHVTGGGFVTSRFSRHVRIAYSPGDTRAIVHVHVSFDTGLGGIQRYHTIDYLRDWSPFANP